MQEVICVINSDVGFHMVRVWAQYVEELGALHNMAAVAVWSLP